MFDEIDLFANPDRFETAKFGVSAKKKVRNLRWFLTQYPDRESNSELSFRRALLYPFNYQGNISVGAKVRKKS